MDLSLLPVGTAAVSAFLLSMVWYGLWGSRLAVLNPAYAVPAPAWKSLAELARSAIVALTGAVVTARLNITDWQGALALGAGAWFGFPAMILAGSVLWERVSWKLAAIHAGDWLLKLWLIAVIVALWP